MTHRDFCYWLKGFFELRAAGGQTQETLSQSQLALIKSHLELVIGPSAFGSASFIGGPTGAQC